MSRLAALAFAVLLLSGCASMLPATKKESSEPEPAHDAAKVPERPFPADSFYALLLAEFALRRQAYEVTLEQYMQQAPKLRDAGVSAHTTHLTQFLQREDDAIESAQLWVELAPENAEANNTLAALLINSGKPVEALPYLDVVEQQTGEANFPMLLSTFSQLTEAQRAQLKTDIDALGARYPDNPRVLLTQALIAAEYQQLDTALEYLDRLLELEPEQPQAVLLEARILVEQKDSNPYERLEKLLKNQPDSRLLRLQYARLLTATDMTAAREQFQILSTQAPRDSDLLFSLALISRETGDFDGARTYMQQVVALGPRADEAYYYLGRMAEDDNNIEEALSNYMQVESGGEYLAANSRIGQILLEQDELERSHAWFEEQRAINPQLQEQLFGLEADILARADATSQAMAVLDQALAETPDQSASLRYARAMLSEQMDDLAAMENDLRTILATDPDNATALNALGYTLADRTNRLEEARQLVARALELQPDEPAILDSMGWVLYRSGDHDQAVEYLTRAYSNFPDPEVAAHLGEVLWMRGDTTTAITVWQGALLRDPDHPVLLETLRRLNVEMPASPAGVSAPAPQP